jgi:hypothetical protein
MDNPALQRKFQPAPAAPRQVMPSSAALAQAREAAIDKEHGV